MASQRTTFGLAFGLLVAGLAILLYGVTLNSGQAPNGPVAVGGSVIVLAIAVLAGGVMAIDAGSETA